jgi:hypothetical protein
MSVGPNWMLSSIQENLFNYTVRKTKLLTWLTVLAYPNPLKQAIIDTMPHKRSSNKSAKKPYAKPTSEESSKLKATKELCKSGEARPSKSKIPDKTMGQTVDRELSPTAVERASKKAARMARKQAKMDHLDVNVEGMRMRPAS